QPFHDEGTRRYHRPDLVRIAITHVDVEYGGGAAAVTGAKPAGAEAHTRDQVLREDREEYADVERLINREDVHQHQVLGRRPAAHEDLPAPVALRGHARESLEVRGEVSRSGRHRNEPQVRGRHDLASLFTDGGALDGGNDNALEHHRVRLQP